MSDSFRKTPKFGRNASRHARSEKSFKAAAHRAERRHVRQALHADAPFRHPSTFGRPCLGPKDGRGWWAGATARDMRK